MGTQNSNTRGGVNCLKCKYYAVTWNPAAPKACKLLGFKSAKAPSAVVYETTGKVCEGFTPKDPQKPGGSGEAPGSAAQGVIVSFSSRKAPK